MEIRYLDETALKALVHRIATGSDPESRENKEDLENILCSFHAYVNAVVCGETGLLFSDPADGQAYRNQVMQYDQDRHGCHETAIINVRVLNRLAARYGIPPVFTGDDTQRHQVASFCLELDQYLFINRRMKLS